MKKLLSIITLIAVFCTALYTLPVTASTEPDYKSVDATVSNDGKWVYIKPVDYPKDEIAVVQYKGTETEITIPEKIDGKNVVGIGDLYYETTFERDLAFKLFADNLKVTKITLPKTIKEIGDYVFTEYEEDENEWRNGNFYVKGFELEVILRHITPSPSISKRSITKFSVDSDNPYLCIENGVIYNKNKTELLLYPAGITQETFKLPDSVKTIRPFAFANTKVKTVQNFNNLKEIPIGLFIYSDLEVFPNIEKVSDISQYAFAYCNNIKSIAIPLRIDYVGSHAFYYCKNLEKVDFGKILTIGDAAFAQCRSLKEAILPKTCKNIYSYAFSNCRSLEILALPYAERIEKKAFNKCYKLSKINTSKSNTKSDYNHLCAEKIYSNAFEECTSLKNLDISDSKMIEGKAFVDCTALAEIHFWFDVPEKIHTDAFKNTAYVNNHKDGVVYIDEIALCYKKPRKAKTTISIKAGTTHIASYCLYKIDGVKQLYLPSSLKNVEAVNISECKDLKRVYISGKKTVFAEASCQNNYRSKTKYYIKSKAYDVLKHFDQKYYSFTTDWKPSKTKSMKAVGKTKSTAKITWKKQGYVTGYKVYMKTSKNGKWKKVATLKGSDSTSYTKKGLSKNKTYYFRVRAYKTVEGETYHGAYSSSDTAKTKKS